MERGADLPDLVITDIPEPVFSVMQELATAKRLTVEDYGTELLREALAKIRLRSALIEGENSGETQPFDRDAFGQELDVQHNADKD